MRGVEESREAIIPSLSTSLVGGKGCIPGREPTSPH